MWLFGGISTCVLMRLFAAEQKLNKTQCSSNLLCWTSDESNLEKKGRALHSFFTLQFAASFIFQSCYMLIAKQFSPTEIIKWEMREGKPKKGMKPKPNLKWFSLMLFVFDKTNVPIEKYHQIDCKKIKRSQRADRNTFK